MHEEREEVPQVLPLGPEAAVEDRRLRVRRELPVGVEEAPREAAEHGREGEVDLGVAVVRSGVEERGEDSAAGEDVAGPEVAVEECRRRGLGREIDEPRRDAFDEPGSAGVEPALVARGAGEGHEAMLGEEDEPRVLRRVRLMQPADARVEASPKGRSPAACRRCSARRVLGRVRRHPCVPGAPVHQEQVGTGRLDPRSRRPCGSQHAQRVVRLRLEATVAARVELRDEGGAPVDLHAQHLAGASGGEVRSAEAPRREGGLERRSGRSLTRGRGPGGPAPAGRASPPPRGR